MPAKVILIVDDDPVGLAFSSLVLSHAGFTPHTAGGAMEALDLLQTLLPDLILSDLDMPNMDGFELARRTRQIARLCDIPMIALSATAVGDAEQRALDAGFTAYMTKPMNGNGLAGGVRRFLKRSATFSD